MSRHVVAASFAVAVLVAGTVLFLGRRSAEPVSRRGVDVAVPADAAASSGSAAPAPPTAARPVRRRAPASGPADDDVAPPAEAAPELGTLRIESDVPGAQVFIDRQFVGTTPLTAENVPPGAHQLNVTAEGFDGIAQTVDVEPGPRDLTFRLRDVRLDAVLAVVHRHRLGSCKGQLVATVDGIRYETPDPDDGFSVALGDVESFEVDYRGKNLRIRLRKGRQFDFADPDGNADRLFIFHRDVENARQRLGL